MNFFILGIIGLAGGFITSGGVFALITSIGLMPRLIGKTHTGRYGRLYEDMVMAGGSIFNTLYAFEVKFNTPLSVAKWSMGIFGIFSGIFVGCLAVSLAEALNSTAIFSRRIKLSTGLSFIVLAAALGKMAGAFIQFFKF